MGKLINSFLDICLIVLIASMVLYGYHQFFNTNTPIYYIDRTEYDNAMTHYLISLAKAGNMSKEEIKKKVLDELRHKVDVAISKLPENAVVLDGNIVIQGGKKLDVKWD